MRTASATWWIALVVPLTGCVDPPWRAYAAAPASPTEMTANATSARLSVPALPATLDVSHEYSLAELIDLAQRTSPVTRDAWERARAAAARLGRAQAIYLPVLALAADGGTRRSAYPTGEGQLVAEGPYTEQRLELAWTLLDLPRFAAVDQARAQVDQASFVFSRKHQEVTFAVARAFYALDAAHARLEAAHATLRTATIVEEAVRARMDVGLATHPDQLQAAQARARAAFDVEAAVGAVRSSEGALAEAVGVAPVSPLRTIPLDAQRLPERLSVPVKHVLAATLQHRPDLKALAADVRARDAEVRAARRTFAPRLTLMGRVDYQAWAYDAAPQNQSFTISSHEYDSRLRLEWGLFEGFARVNGARAAEAERAASAAALNAGTLRALREAWTAYFDVETAQRKLEAAGALLTAAEEAYAATLETYRRGLGMLIDLLTAERDLASARSAVIESRAELLTAAAALVFAIGSPPR